MSLYWRSAVRLTSAALASTSTPMSPNSLQSCQPRLPSNFHCGSRSCAMLSSTVCGTDMSSSRESTSRRRNAALMIGLSTLRTLGLSLNSRSILLV
ncbi:hypothetical protein D3C76_1099510 [compost metagenome]